MTERLLAAGVLLAVLSLLCMGRLPAVSGTLAWAGALLLVTGGLVGICVWFGGPS